MLRLRKKCCSGHRSEVIPNTKESFWRAENERLISEKYEQSFVVEKSKIRQWSKHRMLLMCIFLILLISLSILIYSLVIIKKELTLSYLCLHDILKDNRTFLVMIVIAIVLVVIVLKYKGKIEGYFLFLEIEMEIIKRFFGVLILLILCSSVFAFAFGELASLFRVMAGLLPYLLGGVTTIAITSLVISVFLYGSGVMRMGDMIEFDGQIGEITEMGPIFSKIETPRNETIHIPNIILMKRSLKRLTRRRMIGEKPYIAHFSTTLSRRIPFAIVYCLFFLAIRDTVDDLENDFEKKRIDRGYECIRGLKEDIERKIGELEKILMATQNRSRSTPGKDLVMERIVELKNQLCEHVEYKPHFLIKKLGNHTVTYEFCVYTDHPFHLLKINHHIMRNLKRRFDEFGIEIMSPLQVSRRDFIGSYPLLKESFTQRGKTVVHQSCPEI